LVLNTNQSINQSIDRCQQLTLWKECRGRMIVTRRVPLVEQERLTSQSTWVHPQFLGVSCYSIFSFLCNFLQISVCLFVLVLLLIVLYVLLFWSLCCMFFSFGHCVVCSSLLVIVLYVLLFWSLCCMFFSLGHCVVCSSLLVIVLYVLLLWSLCCMFFSFGHCVVCSSLLVIVLYILLRFTDYDYPFGIFILFLHHTIPFIRKIIFFENLKVCFLQPIHWCLIVFSRIWRHNK
jgi:hypothetical protein